MCPPPVGDIVKSVWALRASSSRRADLSDRGQPGRDEGIAGRYGGRTMTMMSYRPPNLRGAGGGYTLLLGGGGHYSSPILREVGKGLSSITMGGGALCSFPYRGRPGRDEAIAGRYGGRTMTMMSYRPPNLRGADMGVFSFTMGGTL